MARVTFSALLSDCRGKTGDIVFSSWKGRPVVRTRVTPANPDTDNQKRIRSHMALMVAWWHCIGEGLKNYCKLLASGESISGFNGFVKRNVRDLEMLPTPVPPRILPLNAALIPMTELEAETGTNSREIDVTWTDSSPVEGQTVDFYVAEIINQAGDLSNVLTVIGSAPANDEEYLIAAPEGAHKYAIFAITNDGASMAYSVAAYAEATSHA
jgi:hypothetical protein